MTIRMQTDIFGIQLGDQEHRLALYADDLIVFLTRLSISVPNLMQQMELFGRFSGYEINYSKSSILFLNRDERLNPVIQTPFINAKEGFVYLGVKITPDIKTIVPMNYDPLVSEVKESLNKWIVMPVSMIKISILPNFLYLFQALPLPLSKQFFDELNTVLNRFIWNNKKPRLRLRLLYLPYERGGLQLPNFKLYYWSAQLHSAIFYFATETPPAWIKIEQLETKLKLNLYLYKKNLFKKHN